MTNVTTIFQKQKAAERFSHAYRERDFYDRNAPLYGFSKVGMIALQLASVVSSYKFFEALFAARIPSPLLLGLAVVSVQLFIEAGKHYAWDSLLRDFFGERQQLVTGLLAAALAISAASFYTSIEGAGQMADPTPGKEAIVSAYEHRLSPIAEERDDLISRHTWKGTTYIPPRSADAKLLARKEFMIDSLRTAMHHELANADKKANTENTQYAFLFGIFDILYVVLAVYAHWFGGQVAIEAKFAPAVYAKPLVQLPMRRTESIPEKTESVPIRTESVADSQNDHENAENNGTESVPGKTESVSEGYDVQKGGYPMDCEQCGTSFVAIQPHAKFCSTVCRNQHHKEKPHNGIKLNGHPYQTSLFQ